MGSTNLANVPSQNTANDLAIIVLFETMIHSPMIVLWLMNLFGAIGHVCWLDQSEVLHEPFFGSNCAIFDVLCACLQGFAL